MSSYLAPAASFYQSIAGGNKAANTAASAPAIANITQGAQSAQENIYSQVPAGPAQQLALAENQMGKSQQIASTQNQTYQGALQSLASIGSGLGSFSLQELGASLSGAGGAAATGQGVLNTQTQQKASTLNALGSLAGAGGSALQGSFHL
jgi:hypothetical protein